MGRKQGQKAKISGRSPFRSRFLAFVFNYDEHRTNFSIS
jgi:hypothetical protein